MIEFIGFFIGFWLFYALIAYFSKHEIGLAIMGTLLIISGFCEMIVNYNFSVIIETIICIIVLIFSKKLQVNSEEKLEAKRKLKNENAKQEDKKTKYDVTDNIVLTIDDSNKDEIYEDEQSSKYLTKQEKQKLFDIRNQLLKQEEKRVKDLVESYNQSTYIEPNKKKKLEIMFKRSFKHVFKIEEFIIDNKKSTLYYFSPESIFSNIGAFYCLFEIGTTNPRYFALELSFDFKFVLTEWSFTDDEKHIHYFYKILVNGLEDFNKFGSKNPLSKAFVKEVEKIIKGEGINE